MGQKRRLYKGNSVAPTQQGFYVFPEAETNFASPYNLKSILEEAGIYLLPLNNINQNSA